MFQHFHSGESHGGVQETCLDDLVDDAGVQVTRDEPCSNALDLVWSRVATRDDWRLCWLHCHNLHAYQLQRSQVKTLRCASDASAAS